MACDLAKKYAEERRADFLNSVYTDNQDGTTSMKLYYKKQEVIYTVDTDDVERLQEKIWCCNNEGYAVNSSPWTYMHRYIMKVTDPKIFVIHEDSDITNCRKSNLTCTTVMKYTGKPSINTILQNRQKKRRERIRTLISSIKIACVICGFDDKRALHFDHIDRSTKEINVSQTISYNKIMNEIPKCQVLCANCHHDKTTKESTSNRSKRNFVPIVDKIKLALEECTLCKTKVTDGNTANFHFDHIDPSSKLANVSQIANHFTSIQFLFDEIEKCRLLCANCHSIHTHEQIQSGTFKNLERQKPIRTARELKERTDYV